MLQGFERYNKTVTGTSPRLRQAYFVTGCFQRAMNPLRFFRPARPSLTLGVGIVLLLALSGCDLFSEVADERAPRLEILRPQDAATVAGANVLFTIEAEALGEDNFISFVNVNLNGERLGEAERVEDHYLFRWNTLNTADGAYRLEAVAFDRRQARGLSAPVRLVVANQSTGDGPATTILAPRDGEELEGTVRIIVRPEVGQSLPSQVDILIDGITVATITTPSGDSFLYEWDTTADVPGLHVIEAKAYSDATAFRLAPPVSVTVLAPPDDAPPGSDTTQVPGRLHFRSASFTGEVDGGVAVGFNNNLYLGSASDTLYAYTPDGRLRWKAATRGPIRSTPVVGNNEDVFVTSEDGRLYGFTSTGTPLWTAYNTGSLLRSTPTLGVDGTLYFGDADGRVHAVNAFNGLSRPGWPIQVSSSSIVTPPVIARDQTIIVASTDGFLYALNTSGEVIWTSAQNIGTIQVGMALVERKVQVPLPNGDIRESVQTVLYAVSNNSFLYALAGEDGSLLWSYPINGPLRSGPVVGPDGTVYVGTSTGLIALNEEATAFTPRLRFIFPASDVGTPAIDTNNIVYFVSGREVVAINPNNTPVWRYPLEAEGDGPLTISRDGLLLIATDDGLLYALETDSQGLAPEKWPMFQRNARHTGRLGIDATDG